jgi:hypothetical protein
MMSKQFSPQDYPLVSGMNWDGLDWARDSNETSVTKYHKLGSLNNRYLFLTVLKPREFKIKVPDNLVRSEALLLVCREMMPPFHVLAWQKAKRKQAF